MPFTLRSTALAILSLSVFAVSAPVPILAGGPGDAVLALSAQIQRNHARDLSSFAAHDDERRRDLVSSSLSRRAAEDAFLRARSLAHSLDTRASGYGSGSDATGGGSGDLGGFIPLGNVQGAGNAGGAGSNAGTAAQSGQGTASAGSDPAAAQGNGVAGDSADGTAAPGAQGQAGTQVAALGDGLGGLGDLLGGLVQGLGLKDERSLDDTVVQLERALDKARAERARRAIGDNVANAVGDLGSTLGGTVDQLTGTLLGDALKN